MDLDNRGEEIANDGFMRERNSGNEGNEDSSYDESSLRSRSEDKNNACFSELKWKRLQNYYNDDYLELFKSTYGSPGDLGHGSEFPATQFGAVIWTSDEKAKLFEILPSKGRHDLPAISGYIGTKSQLEVKDYLDLIREAEGDRQLFLAQTKNISHPEIPAAIEIRPECEAALEQAADSLAAFQEQYDNAVGRKTGTPYWLIDRDTAKRMDQKSQTIEDASGNLDSADEEMSQGPEDLAKLFYVGKFLDLSEEFFMNQSPESLHDHWRDIAEEGQRPTITADTLSEIHNIVINLTRKIVQTSLFLAQSRIRSSTKSNYYPTPLVRQEDVTAAIGVLDLDRVLWDYWVHLARRNKLNVVAGLHQRGVSDKRVLTYDEVEAALTMRASRGRRRSLSIPLLSSSQNSATSSTDPNGAAVDEQSVPRAQDISSLSSESSYRSESSTDDEMADDEDDDVIGDSDGASSVFDRPLYRSSEQRHQILERQQDEYMEKLDELVSEQEEARLRQRLGLGPVDNIKQEHSQVLGPRPQVLRKSLDEINDWNCVHEAEWERCATLVPEENLSIKGGFPSERR